MGSLQNVTISPQQQEIRVVRVSLVKPTKPTKRHSMYMSVVDQILRKIRPSRTILFYRTDKDPAAALEALRQGLASALVPFYPMAGRVLQTGSRLAIDCNDQGVELIEACCDLPFTELEDKNFHIRPFFRKLAPYDSSETSDLLDDPLASFQITSFVGGFTLGISVSHFVADGHSVWTFVRAVAEACRGEPFSVSPLHTRTLLKPEVFMAGTCFPDMPSENMSRIELAPQNGSEEIICGFEHPPPELLQQILIHFSEEMIEILKKECLSSNGRADEQVPKHGPSVSTYQALAAYLWKRLTMAQKLHEKACTKLRVSADVRTRMIPPLTSAFFGNAILGIPTPVSAGELVHESLGDTAARIRQSIQQGDDTFIRKAIIAHETMDLQKMMQSPEIVMVVRNAIRFPVYEGGDFGWGKPDAVRPAWGWREGEFTWYPGKKPRSIDVVACLTKATCANFFTPELYPNDPLNQYIQVFNMGKCKVMSHDNLPIARPT